MADRWYIRKDKKTYCSSEAENCGYPPEIIRSMQEKGYYLFHGTVQITKPIKRKGAGM